MVARYGGEEFALVLPGLSDAAVRALLGAVLAEVDALALEHADSACARHVTVSLGALTVRPLPGDDDIAGALARTDALLYAAKEGGRHRAVHAAIDGARQVVLPGAAAPQAQVTPGR
jgi:diguanylate cyclase (GGDEF)-like protein